MRISVAIAVFWFVAMSLSARENTAAATRKSTNIPPQELDAALQTLANDRDFQVVYLSADLEKLQTKGAVGDLTVDQALIKLLKGTGLTFRHLDDKTITVEPLRTLSASRARKQARESGTGEAYSAGQRPEDSSSSISASARREETQGPFEELEEIVVTATRRSESNEKVPMSIVVLNQEALEKSEVKDIAGLAALTPGVEFTYVSAGPTTTNISIRGISSPQGTGTTGIYLDDTQIQSQYIGGASVGNPYPLTFDLNRVEVLRGPQGTLFGGGSEGGALRFIQNEPSLTDFSGLVTAEGSSTRYGAASYEIGAAGGGPILPDVLGFRASVYSRTEGGYINHIDPFTGATVVPNANYTESNAARFALTVAPTESLKITPAIFWQHQLTHDIGAYTVYLSDPGAGRFNNGFLLLQPYDDGFYLASLKVDADLGFGNLVSASSYFDRHARNSNDGTYSYGLSLGGFGNPLGPDYPVSYADASPFLTTTEEQVLSQEIRLASKDADARLSWVGGAYFNQEKQVDTTAWRPSVDAPAPTLTSPELEFVDNSLTVRQTALFGQASLSVAPGLKLIGGVRVSRSEVLGNLTNVGLYADPPLIKYPVLSSRETPVTPRLGLDYQADDRNLFYVSAAKGYRPGGPNLPSPSGCRVPLPLTYQSDSVWSYEIGAKDRLFHDRLQIDTSVYHIDWKNIQTSIDLFEPNCSGTIYTANAGAAVSNGFELATQALLTRTLRADVSVSYIDAHYVKDVLSGGFYVVQKGDAVGSLPQAPTPWSVTAAAEYQFQSLGHEAYVRVEDLFHSRNNGRFAAQSPDSVSYNPDVYPNPSTNELNLRASVNWSSADIALFVQNVLDTHPAMGLINNNLGSTLFNAATFRPRTIGLNVTAHFGRPQI